MLTVSAPGGVSSRTETLAEAVCGGLFQVTTPVLVTLVPVASCPAERRAEAQVDRSLRAPAVRRSPSSSR